LKPQAKADRRSVAGGGEFWRLGRCRTQSEPFTGRPRLSTLRAASKKGSFRPNTKYHHANLHRTWRQEQAPDFVLDYLPPYSPDLNPIERVWKLVRRLRLHDEYFPTLQAVMDAVESQFAKWGSRNETLRRLCAI
jgi:transposase